MYSYTTILSASPSLSSKCRANGLIIFSDLPPRYLVCLTVAPAFICAAIYITFRRVVHSCDDRLSYFRPKLVSVFFMSMDFIYLVLQAAGGAITSTSGGISAAATAMRETGVDIMIAGLALQVVSLVLFISYASVYTWRWHVFVSIRGRQPDPAHAALKWRSLVFSTFERTREVQNFAFNPKILTLTGLATASVTVLIRSAFRVAELREGFQSDIASDEVLFMILEGAMLLIACLCLTIAHPGLCLGIPWKITKPSSPPGESFEHCK